MGFYITNVMSVQKHEESIVVAVTYSEFSIARGSKTGPSLQSLAFESSSIRVVECSSLRVVESSSQVL